jgi:hypothetical protein
MTEVENRALRPQLVHEGLSQIARTGDGLCHAFTKLQVSGKGVTSIEILAQYPHLRFLVPLFPS